MTNEEREIAWREQFLDDMQKVGIKPYYRQRYEPALHIPVPKHDPYAELEER
ncbi:hypothetical protein GGR90_002760 [Sphingopyxis italica]|uniref:Uncharacterized protein n=1 Tax=Sphingopyxis italica TaxID=1129133 RepID=A0A7X5XT70_9SPHN|nr:hypothetical protein [Sphingopyxis italica]NJB90566.1 hypothetical protein [Sphingopyxis italica]